MPIYNRRASEAYYIVIHLPVRPILIQRYEIYSSLSIEEKYCVSVKLCIDGKARPFFLLNHELSATFF